MISSASDSCTCSIFTASDFLFDADRGVLVTAGASSKVGISLTTEAVECPARRLEDGAEGISGTGVTVATDVVLRLF